MLQIAVCDDNMNELSAMEQLISQYRETKNQRSPGLLDCRCTAFNSGLELVHTLEKGSQFDIYLLDIIMPDLKGTEVAKIIRRYNQTVPIIFISSSNEYAAESYEVKAAGYILKPCSPEKLFPVLDELLERKIPAEDEKSLIVKTKKGIEKILISNLVYAKSKRRDVLYHLRCGTVIESVQPFSTTSTSLEQYGCFFQPHRCYLVNMQYVQAIERNKITLQTLSPNLNFVRRRSCGTLPHNPIEQEAKLPDIPIPHRKVKGIKDQYFTYQMKRE
jgi:DNA-binding LytR/AlgR family response regulator